jgi:hypothetical protein
MKKVCELGGVGEWRQGEGRRVRGEGRKRDLEIERLRD